MNKKLIFVVLILISVVVCYFVYIQFFKVETFSTNFILLGDTGTGKEIQKKVSNSINTFCNDPAPVSTLTLSGYETGATIKWQKSTTINV